MGGKTEQFDELKQRIQDANQQLEKVAIRAKDGKLYLRGKFPPKPGESQSKRVELGLGVSASIAGLKVALAKAKDVDSQLMWGKFDWKPWLRGKNKPAESVAEWAKKYEASHWEHTPQDPTKENSYHKNYRLFFQRMPQDAPLTLDLMRKTIIEESDPATRSRQFFCMSYRKLAQFACKHGAIDRDELDVFEAELKELRRGYQPEEILPEHLPTDEKIIEIWQSIKNPAWRWVYGMMATYGLRPHEVFNLDLKRFTQLSETLRVFETTKTGTRIVYPCPAMWREQFELWKVQLPKIKTEGKSNNDLGEKICQEFRELKLPHNPYALRHAWCIRTAMLGVPDSIAAKWAGHSVAVRTKTYHQAISESQHRQVFEQMKQREKTN